MQTLLNSVILHEINNCENIMILLIKNKIIIKNYYRSAILNLCVMVAIDF